MRPSEPELWTEDAAVFALGGVGEGRSRHPCVWAADPPQKE